MILSKDTAQDQENVAANLDSTVRDAISAFLCLAVNEVTAMCRSTASAMKDGTAYSVLNRSAGLIATRREAFASHQASAAVV